MNPMPAVLAVALCMVGQTALQSQSLLPQRPRIIVSGAERTDMENDLVSMEYRDSENTIDLVVSNWGNTPTGPGYRYRPDALPMGTQVLVLIGQTKLFDGKITSLAGDFPDGRPPTLTVTAAGGAAGTKRNTMTLSYAREVRSLHCVQNSGTVITCEGKTEGNPALGAGTVVTIAGVLAPFAGRYTITATRHSFDQTGGYRTEFKGEIPALDSPVRRGPSVAPLLRG